MQMVTDGNFYVAILKERLCTIFWDVVEGICAYLDTSALLRSDIAFGRGGLGYSLGCSEVKVGIFSRPRQTMPSLSLYTVHSGTIMLE